VRVRADAQRGAIEVADTGAGIPPIASTGVSGVRATGSNARGRGVGLAISQRIVRALGGELTLTASPARQQLRPLASGSRTL